MRANARRMPAIGGATGEAVMVTGAGGGGVLCISRRDGDRVADRPFLYHLQLQFSFTGVLAMKHAWINAR